jgi:hypothetical protein
MIIGIGGAGGKIAAGMSKESTVINVSEVEMQKLGLAKNMLAYTNNEKGQLMGSKKNPSIGKTAFNSVRGQLLEDIKGNIVVTSSGGGTGNGITSQVLSYISAMEKVSEVNRTQFMVILPYAKREASEYVNNTIEFLQGPLLKGVDSTNTGNIFLFSNKLKYEARMAEKAFNELISDSFNKFNAIPEKGDDHELLEGHIDREDFESYKSKAFFNYFTDFEYSPERYFSEQLEENYNELMLRPDVPIEALFLLEVPDDYDHTVFYNILDHFEAQKVTPIYSVIRNSDLEKPLITVSLLYSRKPAELVDDYNRVAEETTREKIKKSIDQNVNIEKVAVNIPEKAERVAQEEGTNQSEVMTILKRLGKI